MSLNETVSRIEKQHGKGAIMRLGDRKGIAVDIIPTGCLSLDVALGVGGMPRGRVVEIFGPESSGKTTLSLMVAAQAQKAGGLAAIVDAEHALDTSWASILGVNVDDLWVSQPDNGEQALEIAETLVKSGDFSVVIVDSVAALVPKAELEGDMGAPQMGLQARLMSQALRRLTAVTAKSKTCLIFINQIREKIGVFFGNPETTTGGRALKFYASLRLDVRKTGAIKAGEIVTGVRTVVKVVKNKVSTPFKKAEFDLVFGHGINHEGELVDLGLAHGLVEKSGAWLNYGGERWQGRENFCEGLKEDPALAAKLESEIRDCLKGEGEK